MNKIKFASLALFTAFLSVSTMAQEHKFGHVNSQYILSLMPEYDSVSRVLVRLDSMYNVELERLQVEINNKIETFNNDSISPQMIREVKAQEIQDLQIRAQAFQQRAAQDLQNRPAQLIRPLYAKIINATDELAEENGLTYVFDISQGNPLYVSEDKSMDITPLVLEKFGINPDRAPAEGAVPTEVPAGLGM